MNKTRKIIPFAIIESAVDGDTIAMEYVLGNFENYLSKMATKTRKDKFGNSYIEVDYQLKRRLEMKLVMSILKFKLNVF